MSASAIATGAGTFRPGDLVHYCGSVAAAVGSLWEISIIQQWDGRLVLDNGVVRLRNVRSQSIRPCDGTCRCGAWDPTRS